MAKLSCLILSDYGQVSKYHNAARSVKIDKH